MPVVRIEANITGIGGGPGYSRLHFDVADPSPGSTDMDFAEAGARGMWLELANFISNSVTISFPPEALIIDPSTGNATGVTTVDIADVVGGSPDDALPWATQGLVRLRTGVYTGGREARGRTFIAGLTEAASDQGRPTSAFTGLTSAVADAVTQGGFSGLCVISKGVAVPVSTATIWGEWATLRSRRD